MKIHKFHATILFSWGQMLCGVIALLLATSSLSAQQLLYCTQNRTTLFGFADFNDYDPPNVTLQLVSGCGDTAGVAVTQQSNGFQITGIQTGRWSFCYRTVTNGNQYGPNVVVAHSVPLATPMVVPSPATMILKISPLVEVPITPI